VYQGEPRPRPLYIHFAFGAYRETVHVLMHTDIGKDGFNDPQPPPPVTRALYCYRPSA
jgi:hypothetical protein